MCYCECHSSVDWFEAIINYSNVCPLLTTVLIKLTFPLASSELEVG